MSLTSKITPAPRRDRPATQVAAAVALALGCVPAAYAADATDTLEELVVTASRREQTLIEVPYNISAVSGQSLQAAGITNLTDIARVLPGINVPDLGPRASSSNSNIVIRGLNANDPNGSAYLPWESVPLVSTYVDEVPLFVNLALFDVQRVEVLRGPQGTLYGSGAVAGTIKVIHNAPDPKAFAADFGLEGSSTSHAANASWASNGMLNIPIGDSAALRANVGYRKIAGFIDASNAVVFDKNYQPVLANPSDPLGSNFATHSLKGIDGAISTYARAELLWHINGGVDVSLAYQRQDDHSNAFSREAQGKTYTDGVYIPLAPDHRIVNLYALTVSDDLGFATITSSTSFADNGDQSGYDQSPFLLQFNAFGPLYYGSYPRPITEFFTDYKDKSFVEELRLVSHEGKDWDYAVGGFFRREVNDLFQYETIPGFAAWSELPGSANAINQAIGSNYANFGDFAQLYYGGTRPSALSPTDTNYTYARNSEFLDRAVYGELTRHITPQWQVTAGLRVFWQDVSQTLYQTIPYGGPNYSTLPPPQGGPGGTDSLGTTITSGDQKFRNHLVKLNTGYAITPTLRAYATYSEGFRHGGANASAIGTCGFCDSPNTASFQPDKVRNYELGLKGTAGNWLRFSGDLYRMRWSDIQIQLYDYSASAYVANGGTAISQGLELELEAQLGQGWSATFGYGYTDAKVTGDFQVIDRPDKTNVPILDAHDGDRLPYVPRQTVTGSLSYTHALSGELALDLRADASYRSGVSTQINASAAGYQQLGGFTTMDASATLHCGPAWRTRLFVNNLTNTQGISAAGAVLRNADQYAPNYRENYVMRPRTIGISVEYSLR